MRLFALAALAAVAASAPSQPRLRIEISWPEAADGHVVLVLAHRNQPEPRFQTSEEIGSQQMFGADVEGARSITLDASTLGYPRENLADVPAGEYYVQAVLNRYQTFHRSDGHTLQLPMDEGEGQRWNLKPGNLYSEPVKLRIDPASTAPVRIELTKTIPPIAPPEDTKYIRHVRIESKLLSRFWGRPMYLGAVVLLPEGFDEHPDAHYPVLYNQGHFAPTFRGFRTEPPPPNASMAAAYGYKLYQDWSSGRLPRMLVVLTQDANPYYDDSYAVNSENVGPYGDALIEELYPYVERKFRAIGQPWARMLYGGSTGGWRALALQVFHPDFFNGAWVFCPDPIDFRAYSLIDLYKDDNAFYARSEWKKVPIPMERTPDGAIVSDMDDAIRYELVLGSRGRSAEQFDIWQAVYSPVGKDGYPRMILDPKTGEIDHKVAEYWKEHYDLDAIIQRNWKTLGPKLTGKLRFAVGTADNYYLDHAVRLTETFLESTRYPGQGPYYAGFFDYGIGFGHGYSGGAALPPGVANRTLLQRIMPEASEWMLRTAPRGADVKSWRY